MVTENMNTNMDTLPVVEHFVGVDSKQYQQFRNPEVS